MTNEQTMRTLEYEKIKQEISTHQCQKNLLLGNGFSLAFDANIFNTQQLYRQLVKNANDSLSNYMSQLTSIYGNFDAENILDAMDYTSHLMKIIKTSEQQMSEDLDFSEMIENTINKRGQLKEIFIKTILQAYAQTVETDKTCWNFLKFYLDNEGYIFSTNYDLLLPYELVENIFSNRISCKERQFYLDNLKNHKQVNYLHGILCSLSKGERIMLEENKNATINEIYKRIEKQEFPNIVLESISGNKLTAIAKDRYLSECYVRLLNIKGDLVIYGLRFNDSDSHLIKAINLASGPVFGKTEDERLKNIYISFYSENDKDHLSNIAKKFTCKVTLFPAQSVNVWKRYEGVLT